MSIPHTLRPIDRPESRRQKLPGIRSILPGPWGRRRDERGRVACRSQGKEEGNGKNKGKGKAVAIRNAPPVGGKKRWW